MDQQDTTELSADHMQKEEAQADQGCSEPEQAAQDHVESSQASKAPSDKAEESDETDKKPSPDLLEPASADQATPTDSAKKERPPRRQRAQRSPRGQGEQQSEYRQKASTGEGEEAKTEEKDGDAAAERKRAQNQKRREQRKKRREEQKQQKAEGQEQEPDQAEQPQKQRPSRRSRSPNPERQQTQAVEGGRRQRGRAGEEGKPRERARTADRRPNKDGAKGPANEQKGQSKETKKLAEKKATLSKQYVPYVCKRKFTSKYDEYQFGEWRRNKVRVFVTAETELPQKPTQLLEEPDDVQYHMAQMKLEEEIEALNQAFPEMDKDFELTLSALKDDPKGGRNKKKGIQTELQAQFKEQNIYTGKKNEIRKGLEAIDKKILDAERAILGKQKQVHPVHNRSALLEKGIKEIEKRLSTSTLDRLTERQLIAEIDKIKKSRPVIDEIEALRKVIADFRAEKTKAAEGFPAMNEILKCIRQEIDSLKEKEKNFDDYASVFTNKLDGIKEKRVQTRGKISKLRDEKTSLKNKHYDQLIKYEQQQQLLHDIDWLETTRAQVAARDEQRKRFQAERDERLETRKKVMEERSKRQADAKARDDARRKEDAAAKKQIQEEQLARLTERNPFAAEIEQCNQLLSYCNKNKVAALEPEKQESSTNEVESGATAEAVPADRQKEHQERLEKAKLIESKSKQEREEEGFVQLGASKQQGRRDKKDRKTGTTADGAQMSLDYHMIMKFARLGISPPVQKTELGAAGDQVATIRDAMEALGQMEQLEGKAQLTGDASVRQSKEYLALKERHQNQNEETLKRLQQIKEEKKKSWAHVDEDEDQEGGDEEFGSPLLASEPNSFAQKRGKREREFVDDKRGGRGGKGQREREGKQVAAGQRMQRVKFDQINNAANFPSF